MRFRLAALLFVVASIASAQVQKGIQNGRVVDDEGKVLLTPKVARQMKESGAQWVRVQFRLIPPSTKWEIGLIVKYREAINNVRAEGLNVLGVLDNESASGTQSDWTEHSAEAHGGTGDNEYIQRWTADVFRPLMFAFSDVPNWEIWSGPNQWSTSQPGDKDKLPGRSYMYPSNFAWLLKRCFEEARLSKLKVVIVSGGLSVSSQSEAETAVYLQETVKAGVRHAAWNDTATKHKSFPFDAVGVRVAPAGGGNLATQLSAIAKIAADLEPKRPRKIWVTELGWTSTDSQGEAELAAHLKQALDDLAEVPQVGPVFWSRLTDAPGALTGLRRVDGTAKPAWEAFLAWKG